MKDMLERIEALAGEGRLSVWETDFIDSLENRIKAGLELTARQREKLAEIEERYSG